MTFEGKLQIYCKSTLIPEGISLQLNEFYNKSIILTQEF